MCQHHYRSTAEFGTCPLTKGKNGKTQLEAALKDPFPYHNYSHFHTTGLGWCQLWFLEDSVELNYCIFGMHIGLDVRVKSLRPDGKVEVWARSEEYDHTDKCMKLMAEDEGYSLKMTTSKVRTIIKANRKNWIEYNIAMLKVHEKEDRKRAKQRMGPAAKTLLRLKAPPSPAKRPRATCNDKQSFSYHSNYPSLQ